MSTDFDVIFLIEIFIVLKLLLLFMLAFVCPTYMLQLVIMSVCSHNGKNIPPITLLKIAFKSTNVFSKKISKNRRYETGLVR